MRTIATKQPTNDSAQQKKKGSMGRSAYSSASLPRSFFPLSTRMPLLQRKCSCGGGCPRCKEDLGIQTKLKISEPGDKYEQEADRIADEVMRMPEPREQLQIGTEEEEMLQTKPIVSKISPLVQRQIEQEKKEGKVIQTKEQSSQITDWNSQTARKISNFWATGQPLPVSTQKFFELRFGTDFSNVRVQTGSNASESARTINARAFTIGNTIAFGTGEYSPESVSGRKLLAHELTHVLQQEQLSSNYSKIQRLPKSKDELGGSEPRYSYSSNCGWIDWGHVRPTFAKKLIDRVKEASKQMWNKEIPYRAATYHRPKLVFEEKCPVRYDHKEKYRSRKDPGSLDIVHHEYGVREYYLSGFEVGKSDSEKFYKFNTAIQGDLQVAAEEQNPPFSVPYSIFVKGFSDCLDSDKKNLNLRNDRAQSISTLLIIGHMTKYYPYDTGAHHFLNEYLRTNGTEIGRRKNRGVLILAIPEFTPENEEFESPVMESARYGLKFTRVKSILELKRSLKYREQLGVALWIFKELSKLFEAEQIWTESFGHSSFSNEDLPSNLIGFYLATMNKNISEMRTTVEPLCKVYKPFQSKIMFDLYEGRWSKTYSFIPPGFEDDWPIEFNSITPIPPSKNLYELIGYEGYSALTWFFEDAEGHRSER